MASGKKRFAVFDIDGTVIRWQLYHAIVNELTRNGALSSDATSRIAAARLNWQHRSGHDAFQAYERVLVDEYHESLTNLSVTDFTKAVEQVFEAHKDQVYMYTRGLIEELKSNDYLLFAISGSQKEILKMFGDYYGFTEVIGSDYKSRNGSFTGDMIIPGLQNSKGELLQLLVSKHHLEWAESIAVGDTKGDISMLELVEQPIAFNPSSELFEVAKKNGWKVVLERKNVVYELVKGGDGEYRVRD